ncbi:MAG: hypothetical protein AB7P04_00360 [Bacteriovoracia bacterium]
MARRSPYSRHDHGSSAFAGFCAFTLAVILAVVFHPAGDGSSSAYVHYRRATAAGPTGINRTIARRMDELEPAFVFNPPEAIATSMLRKLLGPDSSVLKTFSGIKFSPINGLITVTGRIQVPPAFFLAIQDPRNPENLEAELDFRISFLPEVLPLENNSYLRVRFTSFELKNTRDQGYLDYLHAFPIVSGIASSLLANEGLAKFVEDRPSDPTDPAPRGRPGDAHGKISDFLARKNIRFMPGTNSVILKLSIRDLVDLEEMQREDPEIAKYVDQLRLWQFGPVAEKAAAQTGQPVTRFSLIVGQGRPSDEWVRSWNQRNENVAVALLAGKDAIYSSLDAHRALEKELREEFSRLHQNFGGFPLSKQFELEISQFFSEARDRIHIELDAGNPTFRADPLGKYEDLGRIWRSHLVTLLEDFSRRHRIAQAQANARNPRAIDAAPFLQARVSQKTITSVVRYFRDFRQDGVRVFRDLHVYLQPKLPGFVVRGSLAIDLAKGAKVPATQEAIIQAYRGLYGDFIPFQLAVRVYDHVNGQGEPTGRYGLDLKSLQLFPGQSDGTLLFERNRGTGDLVITVLNRLLTSTLTAVALELEATLNSEQLKVEGQQIDAQWRQFTTQLGANYSRLYQNYLSHFRASTPGAPSAPTVRLDTSQGASTISLGQINGFFQMVSGAIDLDISQNPFLLSGKQKLDIKMPLLLDEYAKIDPQTNSVLMAINPGTFSRLLLGSNLPTSVWNLEAIFDKPRGRAYLDVAIGNGVRSDAYTQHKQSRPEKADSDDFAGEDESSPDLLDLGLKFRADKFTELANQILADVKAELDAELAQNLARNEKGTYYQFNYVGFRAAGANVLEMTITASQVKKLDNRGFFARLRGKPEQWDIERKPITIKGLANIESIALDTVLPKLKVDNPYPFRGSQIMRFDVTSASIDTKAMPLYRAILGLIGINLKDLDFKGDWLERQIKLILMKVFAPKLDNPRTPGSTKVRQFALNKYVRVFLSGEDIFLQVNPRAITPAFEFQIVPQQAYVNLTTGGRAVRNYGLSIDPMRSEIAVNLRTAGAIANSDKLEIQQIINQADQLFRPYLEARTAAELRKLLDDNSLWHAIFEDRNPLQPGLWSRLSAVLYQYPEVLQLTQTDRSALKRTINELLRIKEQPGSPTPTLNLTECGAELAYALSGVLSVYIRAHLLVENIQALGIADELTKSHHYNELVARKTELYDRYFLPLWDAYKTRFSQKNRAIVDQGATDWNQHFYPDAMFANNVYRAIQAALNNGRVPQSVSLEANPEENPVIHVSEKN